MFEKDIREMLVECRVIILEVIANKAVHLS